ncbi:hypothetical protein COB21_05335 [Candidatus Aerophobetes bacterium]|uniref:Uncharacterized protein n=1 Tax=Aerophobetes bacterium TaxID=2030807 RepID=A0A2A4X113_UNCAE|nr:MAG: hypothetical protein COB21_05335 [Candidatus Aerophobetes bacterium]
MSIQPTTTSHTKRKAPESSSNNQGQLNTTNVTNVFKKERENTTPSPDNTSNHGFKKKRPKLTLQLGSSSHAVASSSSSSSSQPLNFNQAVVNTLIRAPFIKAPHVTSMLPMENSGQGATLITTAEHTYKGKKLDLARLYHQAGTKRHGEPLSIFDINPQLAAFVAAPFTHYLFPETVLPSTVFKTEDNCLLMLQPFQQGSQDLKQHLKNWVISAPFKQQAFESVEDFELWIAFGNASSLLTSKNFALFCKNNQIDTTRYTSLQQLKIAMQQKHSNKQQIQYQLTAVDFLNALFRLDAQYEQNFLLASLTEIIIGNVDSKPANTLFNATRGTFSLCDTDISLKNVTTIAEALGSIETGRELVYLCEATDYKGRHLACMQTPLKTLTEKYPAIKTLLEKKQRAERAFKAYQENVSNAAFLKASPEARVITSEGIKLVNRRIRKLNLIKTLGFSLLEWLKP